MVKYSNVGCIISIIIDKSKVNFMSMPGSSEVEVSNLLLDKVNKSSCPRKVSIYVTKNTEKIKLIGIYYCLDMSSLC